MMPARANFSSVPIPKFARVCRTLRSELRNRRTLATPRERVIVQLIAEGHGNKELGAILNLSVKTIESHRAAAMRKLNVTSTATIVRYAVRNELVEP
jgi:DNA-binding NarL/FixJ family response regulator